MKAGMAGRGAWLAGWLMLALASGAAMAETASPERPWWALVPDTYDGSIFSGTGFAKGATEFHRQDDAAKAGVPGVGAGLAGSYAFVEPDGREIAGTLDACRSPERFNLACRWRDTYGEGTVVFLFEESLQGFSGLWFSPKLPKQGMPWTGRRRLGS